MYDEHMLGGECLGIYYSMTGMEEGSPADTVGTMCRQMESSLSLYRWYWYKTVHFFWTCLSSYLLVRRTTLLEEKYDVTLSITKGKS
jgi:hypothetical protein